MNAVSKRSEIIACSSARPSRSAVMCSRSSACNEFKACRRMIVQLKRCEKCIFNARKLTFQSFAFKSWKLVIESIHCIHIVTRSGRPVLSEQTGAEPLQYRDSAIHRVLLKTRKYLYSVHLQCICTPPKVVFNSQGSYQTRFSHNETIDPSGLATKDLLCTCTNIPSGWDNRPADRFEHLFDGFVVSSLNKQSNLKQYLKNPKLSLVIVRACKESLTATMDASCWSAASQILTFLAKQEIQEDPRMPATPKRSKPPPWS